MSLPYVLNGLWRDHTRLNPEASSINRLLVDLGQPVIFNDHIALRTFDDPRIDKHRLARHFLDRGYEIADELEIPEKHVSALHLETEGRTRPKVFISQLHVDELTPKAQSRIRNAIADAPADAMKLPSSLWMGRAWSPPTYGTHLVLADESEYAAWTLAHGFHANHFTVAVHELIPELSDLGKLNAILKSCGYKLNDSGGEIKGSPEQLLEQSSTRASNVMVEFADGLTHAIPGCYTEFAKRYPREDGTLFPGFIPSSANRIFESTDRD